MSSRPKRKATDRHTPPDILGQLLEQGKRRAMATEPASPPSPPISQPTPPATQPPERPAPQPGSPEQEPHRAKQSYMLADEVSKALDRLYLQIRMADKGVSKSELVEIALQDLLDQVKDRGLEAPSLRRLSGRARRKD